MYFVHPQLDFVDEIVRILGWPTLLGVGAWAIRTYDKGRQQFKEIDANTKIAITAVGQVKDQVTRIETNHLAHLQEGISQVAKSNDEAVGVLRRIDTNIQVLADRTPRS